MTAQKLSSLPTSTLLPRRRVVTVVVDRPATEPVPDPETPGSPSTLWGFDLVLAAELNDVPPRGAVAELAVWADDVGAEASGRPLQPVESASTATTRHATEPLNR
jgi:hypothetical protein